MWRSQNRAFVVHDGDPGDDGLGYDFEVLHGRSRLFYEVKASTGDPHEFGLSEAEVRFAMSRVGRGFGRSMICCSLVSSDITLGPWSQASGTHSQPRGTEAFTRLVPPRVSSSDSADLHGLTIRYRSCRPADRIR